MSSHFSAPRKGRRYASGHDYRNNSRGGSNRSRGPSGRNPRYTARFLNRNQGGDVRDRDGDVNMDGDMSARQFVHGHGKHSVQKHSRNSRHVRHNRNAILSTIENDSYHSHTRKGHANIRSDSDGNQWFKITIPLIEEADKEFVLSKMVELTSHPFLPKACQFEGKVFHFYLEEENVARDLRTASRQVTLPNGCKMVIQMKKSAPPLVRFSDENIARIKAVLHSRYDPSHCLLNLSNLQQDSSLAATEIFLCLNNERLGRRLMELTVENFGELRALDLSNNKIIRLQILAREFKRLHSLQCLNLGNNQIRCKSELELLKGSCLKLTELILSGNAVCSTFQRIEDYVSFVRKICPLVVDLDGTSLPAPVTFDIEDTTSPTLPDRKENFLPIESKDLLVKFIESYFYFYDEDRSKLIEAYFSDAVMSLSVSQNSLLRAPHHLQHYFDKSRNLQRLYSSERAERLVKRGNIAVVAFLQDLPVTRHITSSFTVDVPLCTPALWQVTVSGFFNEVSPTVSSSSVTSFVRAFSRTWLLMPSPTGDAITILNDILFITNSEEKVAKKIQAASIAVAKPSEDQLLQKLSSLTGMNVRFCRMCLTESGWDLDKALVAFSDAKGSGRMPPEAFQQ